MQPHVISLVTTPLLTGFVGYFTNYLAIKMLFRPHQRKWYSFGWQGVIPKNRNKLANEIGKLVGNELITDTELKKAIESEKFQYVLEHTIENEIKNFLNKDFGTLANIIDLFGLDIDDILQTIFYSKSSQLTELINNISKTFISNILQKKANSINNFEEIIDNIANNIFSNNKLREYLANEVISYINNFLLSGKSLSDILSEEQKSLIIEKTAALSESILSFFDKLLQDEKLKDNIVKKLIEIKNQYFGNGFFDQLKLGVLNIFLNEETIKELVNNELPKLVQALKEDKNTKLKIEDFIKNKTDQLLSTPLYKLAEKVGLENIYSFYVKFINWLKNNLLSESLKNKIVEKIKNYLSQNPDITFEELLKKGGIDLSQINLQITDKETVAIYPILIKSIEDILNNFQIGNIYNKIPKKTFFSIKKSVIKGVNEILSSNIDKIVTSLNIDKLVEDKINSLDLYKLENLIFSFMKDQFKWINILGFILGFIFGLIQSVILFFA